jgi:hypothetical protein
LFILFCVRFVQPYVDLNFCWHLTFSSKDLESSSLSCASSD